MKAYFLMYAFCPLYSFFRALKIDMTPRKGASLLNFLVFKQALYYHYWVRLCESGFPIPNPRLLRGLRPLSPMPLLRFLILTNVKFVVENQLVTSPENPVILKPNKS